jgi:hypothetical protein
MGLTALCAAQQDQSPVRTDSWPLATDGISGPVLAKEPDVRVHMKATATDVNL